MGRQVFLGLLFLLYYQCKNHSIIVRQHDQGASMSYPPLSDLQCTIFSSWTSGRGCKICPVVILSACSWPGSEKMMAKCDAEVKKIIIGGDASASFFLKIDLFALSWLNRLCSEQKSYLKYYYVHPQKCSGTQHPLSFWHFPCHYHLN